MKQSRTFFSTSVSRALATLEQTREDAVVIKDVISQTKQQLSVATVKSDELLEALTAKATAMEKLKAKLGIGSATLSAFVALIDSEMEEDDTALLQVNTDLHVHLVKLFSFVVVVVLDKFDTLIMEI